MSSGSGHKPICKVCQQQWSRYLCPRCDLQYCSLDCYKKHGDHCTESFYRDNATEQLQSLQASQAEKQSMLQILQRLQQHGNADEAELADTASDSADDAELSDHIQQKLSMADKLEDVEITDDDLTPAELQAFKSAVASGQLNNFVDAWVPWWNLPEAGAAQLSASGTSKISTQDPGRAFESAGGLPAAPQTPLPLLASLTKAVPSPLLQWQLLDILYTYCFVMRLYNGDPQSDPQEAMLSMLQVSSTLQAASHQKACGAHEEHSWLSVGQTPPALPSTASEAFLQCIQRVCSPAAADAVGRATAVGLLKDVATVVKHGRSVVILALHDLQSLLVASQGCLAPAVPKAITQGATAVQLTNRELSQAKPRASRKPSAAKVRIRGALQKLHFLLSWANELSETIYADLFQMVVEESKHHSATLSVPEQTADLSISDPFVKSTMQQQSSLHVHPHRIIEEL